ncbi:MAG: tetratricopeptide repeat protein [Halioglobus sp.]|nr:tetratricopeptide repeat protein [Halioglobus sp.]
MKSIRILISVIAVAAVTTLLWQSRANADTIDHYRPSVLIKAERALERGNPERALSLLEGNLEGLRRDAYRADGNALVCRARYEKGDYAAAEQACDTAVRLGSGPQVWSHLNNRGVMRLLLGRVEEALQDFEAAADLNPQAWSIHRNIDAARNEQHARNLTVSSLR